MREESSARSPESVGMAVMEAATAVNEVKALEFVAISLIMEVKAGSLLSTEEIYGSAADSIALYCWSEMSVTVKGLIAAAAKEVPARIAAEKNLESILTQT